MHILIQVRSGQQVYSPGSSSIVIYGNVNHGGEALSDGDLHIYGKLLGRAICGLKGANSKIFCRAFNPSLIGINEHFINVEDYQQELKVVMNKPVCVSYHYQSTLPTELLPNKEGNPNMMVPEVKLKLNNKEDYLAFTVLSP